MGLVQVVSIAVLMAVVELSQAPTTLMKMFTLPSYHRLYRSSSNILKKEKIAKLFSLKMRF
jgi:hypothetical protein